MRSSVILGVCAFTAVLGVFAQDKPVIKAVPIRHTAANNGAEMFKSYCAPCHGVTGEGNGPAAPALKKVPGNLTRLSERNDGKFPSAHVQAMIQGRSGVEAHGTTEMPVWGPLFRSIDSRSGDPDRQVELRIYNLTKYLESIQAKH